MSDLNLDQFYKDFIDLDELRSLYKQARAQGLRDQRTLDSVIESTGVAMVVAEAVAVKHRQLTEPGFGKSLQEFQATLPEKLGTK